MKRTQGIACVTAGIMLGAAIAGNAAQAAEMLAAQRSAQRIYVNGQQVQMEAYAIGGSNYVKLRDIGKAMGFEVGYQHPPNRQLPRQYTILSAKWLPDSWIVENRNYSKERIPALDLL